MAEAQVTDQAFVTLATNDSYGLGALTLGHSLRRVGTLRKLVCMVTSDLSSDVRDELAKVYDELVDVNILDSRDTVNLALLTRPDLGVTFTKLHCWRLTHYSKCVFMDADTLVLQNIDDLFDREELSAASDVGWPDCFNSGVFVFKPSEETYTRLLQFALTRGSFDGGDQGLLNAFFSDWATKDIRFHVPFLYNVVAQAFYTYKPAFKRFGKDAKVIHFIGMHKPWHATYHPDTGNVDCPGDLGLNCQEFVKLWWEIFTGNVKLSSALEKEESFGSTPFEESFPDEADRDRQLRWETGHADYLGDDRYENIQKQIEAKSGIVLVSPTVTAEEIKIHKEQAIVSLIKQMPSPELSILTKGPPKLDSSKPEDLRILDVKQDLKASELKTTGLKTPDVKAHGLKTPEVQTPGLKTPEPESKESHSVIDAVESESVHSDRRHKWETGQIDYLGEDSFENILKRLDQKTKRSDKKYDRPISATVPIPAPTHKPSTGQFAKLPDKETPYSLMQDAESSKTGSFPSQYFDEDKAAASKASGSFKLQSTAPLARTEDISRKTEISREIPSKEAKSGTFKLRSAFGKNVEPEPQGEVDGQAVVEKVLQKHSVPEMARAAPPKAVSDPRDLPGHPAEKGPVPGRYLFQSEGEQDTQTKRIPGRYVFQSSGEHPASKPAEEALVFRESQASSSSERRAVSPELRKSGSSDSREAREVRAKSLLVAPSQKEGGDIASESRLEEFFDPAPAKSIEYFADVKMVKKMLLKQPDYDVKLVEKPRSTTTVAPKVVVQSTAKAASIPRSTTRLTSGVKSVTVVTKARADKK